MKKTMAEGVDFVRLSEVSDGDQRDMEDLAKKYVQTVRLHLKNIAIAIQNKQWNDVERTAHAAVGTSSMVGMTAIVPSLKQLQSLPKGQGTKAQTLLKKAEKAFDQIHATLVAHHLVSDRVPSSAK